MFRNFSICPLLETDNGVFHRDEAALQDVLENVLYISKMSDGQKISTYQDILNKRKTEIDTLNLAVSKAAGGLPVQLTAALGQLIKIKSGY